jgi:hypothetical protein
MSRRELPSKAHVLEKEENALSVETMSKPATKIH